MKIPVTLKDPDTMHDAVDEAVKRLPKPAGISAEEWAEIREERAAAIQSAIARAYMRYSEYLDVVFDVSDDCRTVTVTVEKAK